jgi:thiocyanate hydrolase subunit alpha
MVRFKQRDLWPDYGGVTIDTLETEFSERWLEPVTA